MKSILTDVARQAGALMMRHFGKITEEEIERKTSLKDLVTHVDREVEKLVMDRLRKEFPDHGLLGEESGEVRAGKEAMFIIDPVDGTTNYAQGVPYFGISIGRVAAGEITHGLIYLPFFDEMYYAEAGAGAGMNGEKLGVSKRSLLSDCVVATGFACVRAGVKPDGVDLFRELIYKTRDLRRLGAASADLAYTARGIFDGYYEMELAPWDVAAGILLVREAGGMVSAFADTTDPLYGKKILVTNGLIHEELKSLIEERISQ